MDPAEHLVTGQSGIPYDWNIIYMFLDESSLQLCKNSIRTVCNRDDDEGFLEEGTLVTALTSVGTWMVSLLINFYMCKYF